MFECKYPLESSNVLFDVKEGIIYVISEKSILLINKETGGLIKEKDVFSKNRRSRGMVIDDKYMYVREFCTLYRIDLETLDITHEWKLGEDASSDLCSLTMDEKYVYVGVRNGPIAIIDKKTKEVKRYELSDSSIWTIHIDDNMYVGNVGGELRVISKDDIKLLHTIKLHKKNLKSSYITNDYIYTAGQDLTLSVLSKETLKQVNKVKKCHDRMFYILGIWKNYILTVSPPKKVMKIWNIDDLSLHKTIPNGSWNMVIDDHNLYMMGNEGITVTDLNIIIENE